jgi:Bacterial protein of unknown function (DUF899)
LPLAKAPADRINAAASERGWSQIWLLCGSQFASQANDECQGDSDDRQWPVLPVFMERDGKIFNFGGTESSSNHVEGVWPWTLRRRVGPTFPRPANV